MEASKLSARKRKFVELYALSKNGQQAATQAGYSSRTASSQASRLLRDENVKRYLHSLLEASTTQTVMKKKEVLVNLSNIARANLGDIACWGPGGLELLKSSSLSEIKIACVQEIAFSNDNKNVRVKLVDKITALSKLLDHHQKMEQLSSQNNSSFSDDDAQKLIEKIGNAAKPKMS